MGLGRRVSDQGLYTAKALGKFDHPYFFQNGKGKFLTLQLEGQHRTEASGLFFHDLIPRMLFQSRIDHFGHGLLLF